ncbi:metallophosphoesterase [Natronosporangium hydrolyticum]|uniref:Metallophosphoesterase n=1 Tax=Natronosporangium hydrolyticum TaxID=2811111 RepID=A0A895YDP0_9ACTN|nr:metallophosphoesterase [Natronosporangium hydrolyticum]QSB14305.1 metallophosphoesterase [Natronosporangium hydrolyticum]
MDPLRRPDRLDPRQLGFTPQPQVPWLSPALLLRTGLRTGLAMVFGAYLDKRELQGALPSRSYRQPGDNGELWLDYVADTGDGFDATYSVAYLLAQPELAVDGEQLPRGQTLVMGGDLVYPSASMEKYEDRLKGPFTAALPLPPEDGPQPTLYALPANHDWYDGLTAFLRVFVGERTHHVGGWRTEQTRSYFAVQLPHNWWLFALDEAFGAYLDDPQLVYFEQVAEQLGPDDRIILVVPAPNWSKQDPKGYDTIDYFLRKVIGPTGARVPMMVAGDQHYYARYSHPERELFTCGGGGAYQTATHTLPEQLTVPPPRTIVRKASPPREYELAARFPEQARSRRLTWGVFSKLIPRNPGFAALIGVIQTLLMLAVAGAATQTSIAEERLFTIPLLVMVVLVMGLSIGLACFPTGGPKTARHLLAGALHGLAQIALAVAGALLWLALPFATWHWPLPLLAAFLLYAPLAALVGAQLVAGYLWLGSWFGINLNELFAAQGIEDNKSFLRLHIAGDGTLTVYPIGVEKVCRRWRTDPDAEQADASWIVPTTADTPRYRLIESPVQIPG